jgi:hypothetical protein
VRITSAQIGGDGTVVHLKCESLRAGYVHELKLEGMKSATGRDLMHAEAYYTLNRVPESP